MIRIVLGMLSKREFIFLGSAIALIFLGVSFIIQGSTYIQQENRDETLKLLEEEIEEFQIGGLTSLMFLDLTPSPAFERVKINFDTMLVFKGDKVTTRSNAEVYDTAITEIILLISSPNYDFNNMTENEINDTFRKEDTRGRVVKLLPDSVPPFQTIKEIPFNDEGENIAVHLFIVRENTLIPRDSSDSKFTVYSSIDRLEAESNQALKQLVEHETFATKVQIRQTDTIIGLTWIAIAVAPLIVSGDILIRLFLKK